MLYPHQYFLYYLILLGLKAKEITALISSNNWELPFDEDDYKKLVKALIDEVPGSAPVLKREKPLVLEPWVESLGLEVFLDPSKSKIKDEIEEILIHPKRRQTLESLISITNIDELGKIKSKMAFAFAADCSEDTILYYEKLFWNQSMTKAQYRAYMIKFRSANDITERMEHKPAHLIEAELGVNAEISVEGLYKESVMALYAKVKQLQKDPLVPEDKLLKYYNMLFKALDRLDKKQSGQHINNVDEQLLLNFDRAQMDREELLNPRMFDEFSGQ